MTQLRKGFVGGKICQPGDKRINTSPGWVVPGDLKTVASIRRNLCDLGQGSDGKACRNCESSCAFGRCYLGIIGADTGGVLRKPRGQKLRAVVRLDRDGNARVYGSISQAAKENNLIAGNITRCCQSVSRTCGGYKWIYKDE